MIGGEIMDNILSLIVTIVSCLIVYSLFDKSGFKAGLIFKLLLQFGIYLIQDVDSFIFTFRD